MDKDILAQNPRATAGQTFTVAPIEAALAAPFAPEFIRYPRPGTLEPLSGLRRSQLYALAAEGHIRTVSLRRKGKTRGTSLIVANSLLGYLRRLVAEQNPPEPVAPASMPAETTATAGPSDAPAAPAEGVAP
jgi:hypothetical protein